MTKINQFHLWLVSFLRFLFFLFSFSSPFKDSFHRAIWQLRVARKALCSQVFTKGLWRHHGLWMHEARSCVHRPSGLSLKTKGKAAGEATTWTEIWDAFLDLAIWSTTSLYPCVPFLPMDLMPKHHWLRRWHMFGEVCGKITKEQIDCFRCPHCWNLYQKVQGPTQRRQHSCLLNSEYALEEKL